MTTVLKSRRSGTDLREHPAVADPADLTIEVVPFKRTQYDRGLSKIIVNGEQWGEFYAEFHGCHGPSYHAKDMHDHVYVPRGGGGSRANELVEARFSPQGARAYRIANIGKPKDQEVKPVPTREQLAAHARWLITIGALRHPDVRKQEIADAKTRYRQVSEQLAAEAKADWDARIDMVLDHGVRLGNDPDRRVEFDLDKLKQAISAAMKWAQTK